MTHFLGTCSIIWSAQYKQEPYVRVELRSRLHPFVTAPAPFCLMFPLLWCFSLNWAPCFSTKLWLFQFQLITFHYWGCRKSRSTCGFAAGQLFQVFFSWPDWCDVLTVGPEAFDKIHLWWCTSGNFVRIYWLPSDMGCEKAFFLP